ncbi:retrovirus-related pol polyprotein from transposon TNT 1-94 [Tanacetum coccineum]
MCPLTRITSDKIVPPKETTIAPVVTPTSGILVYSRRPKATRSVGSSSKVKIVESKTSNSKEPKKSWGSTISDVPFSSLNDYSKKHSHKPKAEDSIQEKLYLLHMDLCRLMRVQSINGRKYILVIVDDFYRFTWVRSFRTLRDYYEEVKISHQTLVSRTSQQNGVFERQNRTLVEAARTMLIFSKAPLFLWAEAVATTCYTQNRSLIRKCHNKTPYELLLFKAPDLSYLHVFVSLCYPTNDGEDLGLVLNIPSSTLYVPPAKNDWEILFQPMFECTLILHPRFNLKGETLYEYYWRFSHLINDMHTIRDDNATSSSQYQVFECSSIRMEQVCDEWFPPSNNQLRTSSNRRNQATILDGRVIVQQVQGRQTQREGHMAKQCTQPKRLRSSAWFKEKLMLAKAQEAGQILDEEQLAFIADPGIVEVQVS